jgi:tetratricopeptide (TPR) repeat protein
MPAMARVDALGKLGRFDEADHAIDALRAARPDDAGVAHAWAGVAIRRADFAEGVRRYDTLLQRPDATPGDRNNAAWLRLFTGTDLQAALELARKAAGPDRGSADAPALNTLAVIEAELGELGAAKLDGWQAMVTGGRDTPNAADWYLHGRIAEQLGLRDDAIAAYRRVPPGDAPHTSHTLARRRLARLGARP